MADILQLTSELGVAIQKDERYTALEQAKKKNDEDAVLQDKIGQLNILVMNFNQEMGKPDAEKDKEKIEKLNNDYAALYNEIMANENMSAYQKAQQELEALANEINSILAMSLNGEDPLTCDPHAQDCTHDCSTCGGCH